MPFDVDVVRGYVFHYTKAYAKVTQRRAAVRVWRPLRREPQEINWWLIVTVTVLGLLTI